MASARATSSVCSLSRLRGRGGEGVSGNAPPSRMPPPCPSPAGGGGDHVALSLKRNWPDGRAATLDDVIRARANHPASSLLGGGTDLVVNIRRGIVAPPVLIDVNHVEELRAIRADARSLEIGAAVKLAELAAHPEVTRHYPVVAQAAGFIAGPTHRNMGTVGGNLCLDTRCLFYNQSEW